MATSPIRIAILWKDDFGETFSEHLLEQIQERGVPMEIVAVCHPDKDSPVIMGFAQNGVITTTEIQDLIDIGEDIDLIVDLSGDPNISHELRMGMLKNSNLHTVVTRRAVAQMMWYFFGERSELPWASSDIA